MQMTANLEGADRLNAIKRQTIPFHSKLARFVDIIHKSLFQTEYKASRRTCDVTTNFTQSPGKHGA